MRVIFWIALLLLIGFAVRKKIRARGKTLDREAGRPSQASTHEVDSTAPEAMVCCVKCQTYVPISEAIVREEQYYCCAAHATPN